MQWLLNSDKNKYSLQSAKKDTLFLYIFYLQSVFEVHLNLFTALHTNSLHTKGLSSHSLSLSVGLFVLFVFISTFSFLLSFLSFPSCHPRLLPPLLSRAFFPKVSSHTRSARSNSHMNIERFSNECRKTKTKVITPANHNEHKLPNEPIRIRSKYM